MQSWCVFNALLVVCLFFKLHFYFIFLLFFIDFMLYLLLLLQKQVPLSDETLDRQHDPAAVTWRWNMTSSVRTSQLFKRIFTFLAARFREVAKNEMIWLDAAETSSLHVQQVCSHLSCRVPFAPAFSNRKRMTSVWPSAAATCSADLPS